NTQLTFNIEEGIRGNEIIEEGAKCPSMFIYDNRTKRGPFLMNSALFITYFILLKIFSVHYRA
ncbi:hypothetical protein V7166_23205, partial [Bacillus thuringiensis]